MGQSWRYDKVRAMVALPDTAIRSDYRQALRRRGFAQVLETETADTVQYALGADHVDLLITAPDLGGIDLTPVLQRHRQQRVGPNPFTVVLSMVDNPTDERVRRAAESGTDDVQQGAAATDLLMGRIDGFARGRKPFIVTHDYVGPARRHVESDLADELARIEVPNPVQWRMMVNGDQAAFERSVVSAAARINLHKVNRTALRVECLIDEIVAAHRAGGYEPQGRLAADQLGHLAADLAERIVTTPFANAWELLESMVLLCRRIARPDRPVKEAEVAILPYLGRFLGRMLGDEAIQTASAEAWRQGLRDADFSLILS